MKLASASNGVRAFREEDIPQVADLHRRVFDIADQPSPELIDRYRQYFTDVFLQSPWREDTGGSLVHEDETGKVTGFLGSAWRRMSFKGDPINARISSQFIVDRTCPDLPGLKLLSTYLAGPQDLSIGDEANPASRGMWEAFGGGASLLYSMRWIYPLRPCEFARYVLTRKKIIPSLLSLFAAPFTRMLDSIVAPMVKKLSGLPDQQSLGEDLTFDALSAYLRQCSGKQSLKPEYDQPSLSWILQRAQQLQRNGDLQKVLVKTEGQDIAGWYLYYLNPHGISEVLHLHANPRSAGVVLDHLFRHAEQHGASVLSGRLEPAFMQAFSDRHCLFHCGPEWVLLHSRRPALLAAFERGDASFSRLEGEWCLHFR
jgi:hypothetical protein